MMLIIWNLTYKEFYEYSMFAEKQCIFSVYVYINQSISSYINELINRVIQISYNPFSYLI